LPSRKLIRKDDQIAVLGDPREVLVRRQEGIAVLAAGGRDQEVDRARLQSLRPTSSSELGRSDVSRAIQIQEREWFKELHEPIELFAGPERVEQFLEDIAEEEEPVA
jgi:hypothetical protein